MVFEHIKDRLYDYITVEIKLLGFDKNGNLSVELNEIELANDKKKIKLRVDETNLKKLAKLIDAE